MPAPILKSSGVVVKMIRSSGISQVVLLVGDANLNLNLI